MTDSWTIRGYILVPPSQYPRGCHEGMPRAAGETSQASTQLADHIPGCGHPVQNKNGCFVTPSNDLTPGGRLMHHGGPNQMPNNSWQRISPFQEYRGEVNAVCTQGTPPRCPGTWEVEWCKATLSKVRTSASLRISLRWKEKPELECNQDTDSFMETVLP